MYGLEVLCPRQGVAGREGVARVEGLASESAGRVSKLQLYGRVGPMEPVGGLAVGIVAVVLFAFVMLFSLASFAFWIWMLVDCANNTPSKDNLKLIWILVIVFTGLVGTLVYFFVQRPKNRASP